MNVSSDQYFTFKCLKGLKERDLHNKKEYKDRLKYEIEIINSKNFSTYFLIVQDIVLWAKKNNITVGPGRGSAAGSLASFCLKITEVDPIKWGLLFERFLNPGRTGSYPDIDLDFPRQDRERVINYIKSKYGEDKVAHIGTFNLMRAKAAVKNVTRTLGHPYAMGEKLSKLTLPPIHGKSQSLDESIGKVKELAAFYKNKNSIEGDILHRAKKVEDLVSSIGSHASAVVISANSLEEEVPLYINRDGGVTTQWEMNNIEEYGLIKFDILGLAALDKIQKCIELIEYRHGKKLDPYNIPLDDEYTFSNLQSGDTVGVFQLEASSMMKDLLVKIQPKNIEDLAVLVAIGRPGPLSSPEVKNYLEIRAGRRYPTYLVNQLEPILGETYGLIAYQEQAMRISTDICGFTLAEADILRKGIGKKKDDIIASLRAKFLEGGRINGYNDEVINTLWQQIEAGKDYQFNACLSADTLIKTPEGDKEIKNLNSGEKVISFDILQNKEIETTIKEVIENEKMELLELELENGEIIKATKDHKFLCTDSKYYTVEDIIKENLDMLYLK